MLAIFTSTWLLLASAVVAQTTPSVVTFISLTATPSVEQVFSILPIDPHYTTTACYENCIMPPCSPCGNAPSVPVILPITSSVAILPITSSIPVLPSGSMGIPQGETPIPSSLLSSVAGPVLSSTPSVVPSRTSANGTLPSATSSPPPQQSTAGASPSLHGEHTSMKLALAVSGFAFFGATMVFFR